MPRLHPSLRIVSCAAYSHHFRLTYRVAVGPDRVRSAPPASKTPAASILCCADADSSVRSARVHTPGPLLRHCHHHGDPPRPQRRAAALAHLRQSTPDAQGPASASWRPAAPAAPAESLMVSHASSLCRTILQDAAPHSTAKQAIAPPASQVSCSCLRIDPCTVPARQLHPRTPPASVFNSTAALSSPSPPASGSRWGGSVLHSTDSTGGTTRALDSPPFLLRCTAHLHPPQSPPRCSGAAASQTPPCAHNRAGECLPQTPACCIHHMHVTSKPMAYLPGRQSLDATAIPRLQHRQPAQGPSSMQPAPSLVFPAAAVPTLLSQPGHGCARPAAPPPCASPAPAPRPCSPDRRRGGPSAALPRPTAE